MTRGKRRKLEFACSSCERAVEIIGGVGVTAGKAGTSDTKNGLDLIDGRATAEQMLGDPQVGDTPIGRRETLGNAQSVQAAGIDVGSRSGCERRVRGLPASRDGVGARVERVVGRQGLLWRRGDRQGALGCFHQGGALEGQAALSMQDLDPGSVAAGLAPCRLLIGEAGQPSQMTPVGASQISAIEASQLSADGSGGGGLEWSWTDLNPGLEMTGAGLEHDTGLVTLGAHDVDDVGVGPVQIEENVAGVTILSIGMDVDVTTLAVAQSQKTDRWATGEIGGSPQALSGKCPSGWVVNQTNQIDFVGHCRQLPADGLHGEEESAIHDRERKHALRILPCQTGSFSLQKTGSFLLALTPIIKQWTDRKKGFIIER